MNNDFKTVLVVGAGTMGHGIAEVCAIAGYRVILVDINEEILKKALERIQWSLSKLGKKTGSDAGEVLSRISISTNLAESAKLADIVIEAVVERTDVKREVFRILDENCRADAILATNTSTIPIADIAKATGKPENVLGLHFFNPPALIRLVEIVKGEKTSEEALEKSKEFVKSLKMDFVVVKDVPGFLVNRINARVFVQAVKMLEKHSVEEIDACARYRLNMPMGIFEVIDFSGVDVLYNVLRELSSRGFDVEIPEIIEKMVSEGKTGMKAGEGFYKYEGVYGRAEISKKLAYNVYPLLLISPAVNEACWILRNGVAEKNDIEKAMKLGMRYWKGVLELADIYGIDEVIKTLRAIDVEPDELLLNMEKDGRLGKKTGEGFFRWKHEKACFGPVEYEKRDKYAFIRMKRAEKLNALNEEMWTGLRKAIEKAKEDADVRAVLLTGDGRAFSAGDDIAVMGSWKKPSDGKKFFEGVVGPLINTMSEFTKPLIALVNGLAFGGGMEINLFADVVIASRNARFALPEGRIGAFPPIASSIGFLFSRGLMRYCLTGEEFESEEALRLGVVDLVVDINQLEIAGVEMAEKIAEIAPFSLQAVKKVKNALLKDFMPHLENAISQLIILSATEDFSEGMRAFIEKRKPDWRGS